MGRIVILTGAGISAESGLGTFRDEDGLWSKYDLAEVATPEGFARNPTLVHGFYNARRRGLIAAEPNSAHRALARLQQALPGQVYLVTQNIDDLHERGGASMIVHMHGELLKARCDKCRRTVPMREDLSTESECGGCRRAGGMRPDVVWFGEMPMFMDSIAQKIDEAELFVSIGTSGQVYPAAGYVQDALMAGARTLELNLERTSNLFQESRQGPATEIVPAWVEEMIAERA